MTKKELQEAFKQAITEKAPYIGVRIRTRGQIKDEVIVNPIENFESKLEYYNKAYNDDLILNSYDGISIVAVKWQWSFEYLEDLFDSE